jgi:hypothetical protein
MVVRTGRPSRLASVGGYSRPPDITAVAVAESVHGTAHRDASARLFGSCPDLRRAAFTTHPAIFKLLQPDADSLRLGQGHAAGTGHSTIWDHHRSARSIWIASSLRAEMIFGKDNYQMICMSHPGINR